VISQLDGLSKRVIWAGAAAVGCLTPFGAGVLSGDATDHSRDDGCEPVGAGETVLSLSRSVMYETWERAQAAIRSVGRPPTMVSAR
jgi:hypothetical protein